MANQNKLLQKMIDGFHFYSDTVLLYLFIQTCNYFAMRCCNSFKIISIFEIDKTHMSGDMNRC